MITKATMFLRQIFENGKDLYLDGLENIYLGSLDGKTLLAKVVAGSAAETQLKAHPYFESALEGSVLKMTLPDDLAKDVVVPFMEGKYSAMSRTYVEKVFPIRHKNGSICTQREICDRSQSRKEALERSLSTTAMPDSEFYSGLSQKNISATRDIAFVETIERRLKVTLPDYAEIYSKPDLSVELIIN